MASTQQGNDNLVTDDVTTLNGATITGQKVQSVKVGFGVPGTHRDVDAVNPLPVAMRGVLLIDRFTQDYTAAATGAAVDVGVAGNVTFSVINGGTAFTGAPVIVFEQSPDGGTSWAPLDVKRSDTGQVLTTDTLAPLAAGSARIYDAAAEGVTHMRVRFTTGPTAGVVRVVWNAGSLPFTPSVNATPNLTPSGSSGTGSQQLPPPRRAAGTGAVTTALAVVAAPAAGLSIYVTSISASNAGTANTLLQLFAGTTAPTAAGATAAVGNDAVDYFLAGNGGGASEGGGTFLWKLPAATQLSLLVSTATTWYCTVRYYIAP